MNNNNINGMEWNEKRDISREGQIDWMDRNVTKAEGN